ncbi:MAG: Gfo/Idh/MocA family protein [Hyphomicrobiaceae bacterium]
MTTTTGCKMFQIEPMESLGIGIIGGGYMGKAHAVAMSAVVGAYELNLRPTLEMVCARTQASAANYRDAYGFRESTDDWRRLVASPAVQAIVIASPQQTHREIALAAFAVGKPVLCEKPLGANLNDSSAMAAAAAASGAVNMVGFNYIKTPATQFAMQLVRQGAIGDIVFFRGEHTEDFFADPQTPASWRSEGVENGAMGDLAPHIIQCALAFCGPITDVCSSIQTIHALRPSPAGQHQVTNDDQAQMMCRFENGATGHLLISRVATGRKMGYSYEITGTKGALRFDQEDQNALWLYETSDPVDRAGFRKIMTGPAHPDYRAFCQGPGHGTGYQDQIIIEASHFVTAIDSGRPAWPDFQVGLDVHRVAAAALQSHAGGAWTAVDSVSS